MVSTGNSDIDGRHIPKLWERYLVGNYYRDNLSILYYLYGYNMFDITNGKIVNW